MANKLLFYFSFIALIFLSCEDKRDYDNPLDPAQSKHIQKPTITNIELYDLSKIEITMLDQTISLPSLAELHYTGFIIYRNEGFGPKTLDDSAVLDTVSFATVLSTTGGVTSKLYVVIDTSVSMETAAYNYAVKGIYNDVITPISDTKSIETVLPPPNLWALTRIDDQSIELKWEHIWSTSSRIDSSTKSGDNKASVIEEEKIEIDHLIPILKESKNAEKTQKVKTEAVNESTLEIKYLIERSIDSGDFTFIDTVDEKTLKYIDKGLKLGKYSYRVRIAVDEAVSASSIVQSTTLVFLKPLFTSTKITKEDQITLQWQSQTSYQKGFVVKRKDYGGTQEKVDTLDNSSNSFIDNGVSYGNQYEYTIHAFSDINESDQSWATLEIVLQKPTVFNVNKVDQSAQLSWTDNNSFEKKYIVEKAIGTSSTFNAIADLTPVASYSYTDNTVTEFGDYKYRLKACSENYCSEYSDTKVISMFSGIKKYVSAFGSDLTGDGSADKPFKTIAKADNYYNENTNLLIVIAEGTYSYENNQEMERVAYASNFLITGDTSSISKTIINGYTTIGIQSSVIGLTIGRIVAKRNAKILNSKLVGQNIYVDNPTNIVISDCVLQGNLSTGVYINGDIQENAKVSIINTTISNTTTSFQSGGGAGIYHKKPNTILNGSKLLLENVTIKDIKYCSGNNCGSYSAMYIQDGFESIEINNSEISNNVYFDHGAVGLFTNELKINNLKMNNNGVEQGSNTMSIYVNQPSDLTNLNFTNNGGRGLFAEGNAIVNITESVFMNNGTGMVLRNFSQAENCVISSNDRYGVILKDKASITNSVLEGNGTISLYMDNGGFASKLTINGKGLGTGIKTYSGDPELKNIVISNVKKVIEVNDSNLTLFNMTVSNATNGITTTSNSGIAMMNSIFWDVNTLIDNNYSTLLIQYSNIKNGNNYSEFGSGAGNISEDPLFDSNYKLLPSSPCIDAGNPSSAYNDADGTRNDMGAFGGPNGNW